MAHLRTMNQISSYLTQVLKRGRNDIAGCDQKFLRNIRINNQNRSVIYTLNLIIHMAQIGRSSD